ncbi:MAG: ChaN family lipoprotein [Proteobacteria bacterium]|nr:ChaN family lipoprotein [Pseudomonadota bacterium]
MSPTTKVPACGKVGTWLDPATGKMISPGRLMAALARRPVVLLGEQHDNAEHHRWQLQMLAALHAHKPDMIVGFEMFPRRVQPALDRWAVGALNEKNFLRESDWETVWGFNPDLYLPLFHFVRQNRLTMIALNIDRALVSRVGREGRAAIPADQRGGLSDPAAASDAYLRYLADVYATGHGQEEARPKKSDPAAVMADDKFKRFVAAQLTWDRAMAEAVAKARRKQPASLVVGIMGQGHVRFGHGVAHQLADLGVANTAIVLPIEPDTACTGLPPTIADAVFVVAPPQQVTPPPEKPRLGIMMERSGKGVRIMQVVKGSVAEASNFAAGDTVVSAAGQPIEKISQFITIVRRQAPGTWLPIMIRRNGRDMELVAKFPPTSQTELNSK